ncbi:hypothetical protein [Vibrio spartinae]|uniref:Uncharacterized protein n=1 Tax=Vibrio spartinae TaxID=1918945 RepID=A0A1N6M5B9_9VIBR|nr:hypothetical protein [Vibrio spartinae]SIO94641.1 hypothetical protein VSP9026_02369 [Vibrio spartinae]
MCNSIQKYLLVLHDHDISATGVGARHMNLPTSIGGGGYLNNYSKLELSLSDSEIESALRCLHLPEHWRDILNHVGALKFLDIWRRLESVRLERSLRISIPTYTKRHHQMSADEFEHWLDGQRLSMALFEIYVVVSAEEYRYIWRRLYKAAYYPSRKFLRVYVPVYQIFNNHLRKILAYSLFNAGMEVKKVSHQLTLWTNSTRSQSRLNAMQRRLKKVRSPSQQEVIHL